MKFILFLLVLLFLIVPVNAVDWFDSDWKNRRNITINHSMVDAEIIDFPTMVAITQLGLNMDGNDTRLTDSSGNQVAREIECYNATSGELVFFYNGTSISNTSDTIFWIYYNNTAATEPAPDSTYGSQAVWDGNYKAVYHMNYEPNGAGASTLLDSTSNAYHQSPHGFTTDSLVDGEYGKGIAFDDTNDYFDRTAAAVSTSTWDILIQHKTGSDITNHANLISASGVAQYFIVRHLCIYGGYYATYDTGWKYAPTALSSSTEYIASFDYATAGTLSYYLDGVATGSDAVGTGYDNCEIHTVGAQAAPARYYNGNIYEIRYSNIARSSNYITTTHNNLNNPTATGTAPFFTSFGEEESYEAPPPTLNGTYLYPNSTYSVGYYGSLTSEVVYETGINFSDLYTFNLLSAGNMEFLSIDDTNYIPSIDKDAAHDGYMYGNFSLHDVGTVNFINIKTIHNRVGTNPVILGLFNLSTQKWHAVNNSSVETVDVEMTYNITGTDIVNYSTLTDNVLSLSVSLNTNGDGNEAVYVDYVEVYIDYGEVPCPSLECVYNLVVLNQNNISMLQNDFNDLENNVDNLYLFVLLCTVFLVATLRKRGDQ